MKANMQTLFETHEPGFVLVKRGKVRDVYRCGYPDQYLLVATDRISAFDCVLPTPIPGKGIVLTQMSNEWFRRLQSIVPNHLIASAPLEGEWDMEHLHNRSVLVRRADPLPVEAIVRGYLAGSAWDEYKTTGTVGGNRLPAGLKESDALPQPVFTPTTKAPVGQHDAPMTIPQMQSLLGAGVANKVIELSLAIYKFAADYAARNGIILADTKLEFGLCHGELLLIDEAITPDSSRFWDQKSYKPGQSQPSFDKQFVRDYLTASGWNRRPPAPPLPPEVVAQTSERYWEALRRLFPECYEECMVENIRVQAA